MTPTKEILSLAVEIGDVMLRNGAEIYRVEDSVIHILKAFEVESFDVYVLSNGIFASANENKDDACSMIRHVPLGSMNLAKITALNQLTRDICNHQCSIEDAWGKLESCKNLASYKLITQVFSCAVGCSAFCYIFGGTVVDAAIAFAIGIIEQFFLYFCKRTSMSRIFTDLFTSFFDAGLTILMLLTPLPLLADKVIIGAIMPLVPGIAFTTAIRDIYNGDYLSGTIHLIDALMTALCIAVGVLLAWSFARMIGGGAFAL